MGAAGDRSWTPLARIKAALDDLPSWLRAQDDASLGHLVWWTRGGATTLPNLALLCRPHHRMVHEDGWRLVRHKDGRFRAIPPPRAVMPNSRSA